MITLDWQTFNFRYMSKNRIFVLETDDSWELFTSDGLFIIKCSVEKYAEQTENIMFIERYFNNRPNIIKVLEISEYVKPLSEEEIILDEINSMVTTKIEDVSDEELLGNGNG